MMAMINIKTGAISVVRWLIGGIGKVIYLQVYINIIIVIDFIANAAISCIISCGRLIEVKYTWLAIIATGTATITI